MTLQVRLLQETRFGGFFVARQVLGANKSLRASPTSRSLARCRRNATASALARRLFPAKLAQMSYTRCRPC
jgi:hypothetical protein